MSTRSLEFAKDACTTYPPNYGPGGPGNGAPSSVTITATSGGNSVLPPTVGANPVVPVNQSGGSTVLSNDPTGGFSAP